MNDYLRKLVSKGDLAQMMTHWSQFIFVSQDQANLLEVASANLAIMSIQPSEPNLQRNINTQIDLQMDWEHLHQLSEGSVEFELELLQLFVTDSDTHVKALEKAIATHNLGEIERAIHHLKGASANIGAKVMQIAADKLEQQVRHRKLYATNESLLELKQSLDCIRCYVNSQN
jgi:HPt (histidine-containing phosphotransfer) domain-containing protein